MLHVSLAEKPKPIRATKMMSEMRVKDAPANSNFMKVYILIKRDRDKMSFPFSLSGIEPFSWIVSIPVYQGQ